MASPQQRAVRILVVDDEPVVQEVIRNVLDRPGMFLVEALDGEKAIDLLLRERFDLLIVDKNLPGITGLDVIRRARAQDPEVAALLITAYASRESVEEAMAIGVDDYIVKPFAIQDLMAKVEQALLRRLERIQRPARPIAQARRLRALVCAPDEGERRLLSEALEILGHGPAHAVTLSQALSEIRQGRADLLVCDVGELSRNDATACFLRSAVILASALKVVAVSSRHELEGALEALRSGASKVVYRPLADAARLAELLREFLEGGREKTPVGVRSRRITS
ncbi:MAG: response regulator [Myxococcales bacterium]|nr:response regulator [Myxococcales bacterium]